MNLLVILYDPLGHVLNCQAEKQNSRVVNGIFFFLENSELFHNVSLKDGALRKYNLMKSFKVKNESKHYKVLRGLTCAWKMQNFQQ